MDFVIALSNQRNDMLMANYWSLTGNGYFGTFYFTTADFVHFNFLQRPTYWALNELAALFLTPESLVVPPQSVQGPLVQTNLKLTTTVSTASTIAIPSLGRVSPNPGLPSIVAIASLINATFCRVIVMNKHLTESSDVTIDVSALQVGGTGATVVSYAVREFYVQNVWDAWPYFITPPPVNAVWEDVGFFASDTAVPTSTLVISMKPHSAQSLIVQLATSSGAALQPLIWLVASVVLLAGFCV